MRHHTQDQHGFRLSPSSSSPSLSLPPSPSPSPSLSLLQAPRRKSVLPAHLHSVMGSANLRLARGDAPGAIELCLEVIRQGERF